MGQNRNNLQRTLAKQVTISGTGLHSGERSVVVVHPAAEDTGIVFGGGGERVAALASNVLDTSRGTTIGQNEVRFRTIEHLMAALSGLGINNAYIEVEGSELPALDGSSKRYVDEICAAGNVELSKPAGLLKVKKPIWVQRGQSFILAVPSETYKVTYVMNYAHPLIGVQSATFEIDESSFGTDIAPARTFVTYEEIAGLVSNNLAKGGSLENAIVVWQDRTSTELRFPDELVRHKILDIVGDLALAGGRLAAEIVAVKSGHALNVEFARKLMEQINADETREAA